MHKLNPRTAALLSAFGWAVGYLLAGKVLAVLLPMPPGGAARFFRVCLLAPLAEEGVFRGAVQRRAQPLGRGQAILLQAVLFALQHGTRCRHGLCAGVRAGSGVAGRPHWASLAGGAAAQCKQSAGAGDGMRGWNT